MKKLNVVIFLIVFQLITNCYLITCAKNRSKTEEPKSQKTKPPRRVNNSRRIAYCDDQVNAIARDEKRDSQWDSLRGSITDKQFRCPYKNSRFGREGNCRSYYNCTDDRPCLGLCSPEELFDVRSGQCVLESGKGGTKLATCYQEEFINCTKSSGVYRNDRQCDRYFKCKSGRSYLIYCLDGEKFDVQVQRCLPEAAAVCKKIENVLNEEIVNFSLIKNLTNYLVDVSNASATLMR